MKIYLMTDMEGVAGIMDFDDWCVPSGRYYQKGIRLLTEEVNAAVDAFFAEGAEEVLVVDGHGAGGIDCELLDERAKLLKGRPYHDRIFPFGMDCMDFDAIAYVGQHAKAGTPFSHITHTQSFAYKDLEVNGISIGEYGQGALCAFELGIPVIFAAGEEALAREAEALTPGVVTVSVKKGLLDDGLDYMDAESYAQAKLGAIHLSPKKVRKLIREKAAEAIRKFKKSPQSFKFPELKAPYHMTVSLRRRGDKPSTEMSFESDSLIDLLNQPYK